VSVPPPMQVLERSNRSSEPFDDENGRGIVVIGAELSDCREQLQDVPRTVLPRVVGEKAPDVLAGRARRIVVEIVADVLFEIGERECQTIDAARTGPADHHVGVGQPVPFVEETAGSGARVVLLDHRHRLPTLE
jgi:hypothetical protein